MQKHSQRPLGPPTLAYSDMKMPGTLSAVPVLSLRVSLTMIDDVTELHKLSYAACKTALKARPWHDK